MPYRRIRSRLTQADTWPLELYLSLYVLLWGLAFANPLTDAFSISPMSYAILRQLPGGEPVFGTLVTSLGALAVGASIGGSRRFRSAIFGASGLFWFGILVAIGIPTHWAAGGLPHFALAAFACWFCWVRLRNRGTP